MASDNLNSAPGFAKTSIEIPIGPADAYRLELDNVSASIRGEAELMLGRADAIGQARAMEALHRSASTGAPVVLQQASESVR